MQRAKRVGIVAGAVLGVLAVLAPVAQANHHLMRITEIYPGTGGNPDSAYVELQMYAAGQNVTDGQTIRTYNATGSQIHAFTMDENVDNGKNQSTVLIADQFPPDATADFTDTSLGTNLPPAGGAVCFTSTSFPPIDCVSWGAFTGNAMLPTSAGSPAPAIPDGSALERDITAGCATALEASDDTNNSSADFSVIGFAQFSPTPNSVNPTAGTCQKPNAKLTKKPKSKTTDRTPKFKFKASPAAGATFKCKVDKGSYKACSSPFTSKKLKFGKHTFFVRAKNENGSGSPAKAKFKVVKK